MRTSRLTLTVDEAAALLGVSRSVAYAEARRGTLAGAPVLRVGRRLLVPRVALERALGIAPGSEPTHRET